MGTPNALRPPGSIRKNTIYTASFALPFPLLFSSLSSFPRARKIYEPPIVTTTAILQTTNFFSHRLTCSQQLWVWFTHYQDHHYLPLSSTASRIETSSKPLSSNTLRIVNQLHFTSPVQLQLSITTTSAQDVFPQTDCQARRHGVSPPKTAQMGWRRCLLHARNSTSLFSDSSESKFQISRSLYGSH